MTWEEEIISAFNANDIEVVAYLPDTVLWPLIQLTIEDDAFETVCVSREEAAIGVLSGAWLGGKRGALLCQTSGLANAINGLGSLNKPWGIPFVGVVSRRGDLAEHNLAQVPAGYGMPDILDAIGVRHHSLTNASDVEGVLNMAAQTAYSTEDPYVTFAENTLTGGK
jgi:sulfopyruvate decarboxylase alpha subunit